MQLLLTPLRGGEQGVEKKVVSQGKLERKTKNKKGGVIFKSKNSICSKGEALAG